MVKVEFKFKGLKAVLNIPFLTAIVILFELGKMDIAREAERLQKEDSNE